MTIEPALLLKGDIMVSSHGKEMTEDPRYCMGGVVIVTLLTQKYFEFFFCFFFVNVSTKKNNNEKLTVLNIALKILMKTFLKNNNHLKYITHF